MLGEMLGRKINDSKRYIYKPNTFIYILIKNIFITLLFTFSNSNRPKTKVFKNKKKVLDI